MNTARQLDNVIDKLSGILDNKSQNVTSKIHYNNEPLQKLAAKQKNLEEIRNKEQKKADQLIKEIAEIEQQMIQKDIPNNKNDDNPVHLKKNNKVLKTKYEKKSLRTQSTEQLNKQIHNLKQQISKNQNQRDKYEQNIIKQSETLKNEQSNHLSKVNCLRAYEDEFDVCGVQLNVLKNQCDGKLKSWQNVRKSTKTAQDTNKKFNDSVNTLQGELYHLEQTKEKLQIKSQLFEQLQVRLNEQTKTATSKAKQLLKTNNELINRIEQTKEQSLMLQELLQSTAQLLDKKNILLQAQIPRVWEIMQLRQQQQQQQQPQQLQNQALSVDQTTKYDTARSNSSAISDLQCVSYVSRSNTQIDQNTLQDKNQFNKQEDKQNVLYGEEKNNVIQISKFNAPEESLAVTQIELTGQNPK